MQSDSSPKWTWSNETKIRIFALPLCILLTFLFHQLSYLASVYRLLVGSLVHELGHAFAYWLSSRAAIPTHIFFTIVFSPSFSLITFLFVTLVTGYLCWKVYSTGHRGLLYVLGTFYSLFLTCTALFSDNTASLVGVAGGFAGELLLSSFFICSFFYLHHPRPWWTWALLFIGTNALVDSTDLWYRVWRGSKELPFGSFLFGDSHGDLNTLMESFSLSREVIVQLYGGLALFSLSLVLAHYFTLGVLGFGDSSQEDEAKGF